MTSQSVIAIVFILLAARVAAKAFGDRHQGGWIFVVYGCLVIIGGSLALWLVSNWAGWLTAILFAFLIAGPIILGIRASTAVGRGEWDHASRLTKLVTILYPGAGTRIRLEQLQILKAHDRGDIGEALARIEALGSPRLKNASHLDLAFVERDWQKVLAYARIVGVAPQANWIEIRALGELGLVEEMIQAYKKADKYLGYLRPQLMLNVLAFAGHVDHVEQLLDGNLIKIDSDDKSYWTAVARLRRSPGDKAAQQMLENLVDTTDRAGLRLAATVHLRNLSNEGAEPSPSLSADSQTVISQVIEKVRHRARERRRWKTARRAVFCMFLIYIVASLLITYWREGLP